eukprot:tig00020563_g11206.t1
MSEVRVFVIRRPLNGMGSTPVRGVAHSALLIQEGSVYWVVEYMHDSRVHRWNAGAMSVLETNAAKRFQKVKFSGDRGGFVWEKQLSGAPAPAGKNALAAEQDMRRLMDGDRYEIANNHVCHRAQERVRVEWGLLPRSQAHWGYGLSSADIERMRLEYDLPTI